ncbi:MAG: hypothetical protein K6A92_03690 [Lachnospiraceae bacterium]|nr:hypothetical protein [Lachnospiraceae bacterium]
MDKYGPGLKHAAFDLNDNGKIDAAEWALIFSEFGEDEKPDADEEDDDAEDDDKNNDE